MKDVIKKLEADFEDVTATFSTANFPQKAPVFAIRLKCEASLANKWKPITNVIAAKYRATIEDSWAFERWNTYIFFMCPFAVAPGLRALIENDKFAARKIVIANDEAAEDLAFLIKKYITGEHILYHVDDRERSNSPDMSRDPRPKRTLLMEIVSSNYVLERMHKNERTKLEKLLTTIENRLVDEA